MSYQVRHTFQAPFTAASLALRAAAAGLDPGKFLRTFSVVYHYTMQSLYGERLRVNTPKRTGHLRRSYQITIPSGFDVEVANRAEYALPVRFQRPRYGTRRVPVLIDRTFEQLYPTIVARALKASTKPEDMDDSIDKSIGVGTLGWGHIRLNQLPKWYVRVYYSPVTRSIVGDPVDEFEFQFDLGDGFGWRVFPSFPFSFGTENPLLLYSTSYPLLSRSTNVSMYETYQRFEPPQNWQNNNATLSPIWPWNRGEYNESLKRYESNPVPPWPQLYYNTRWRVRQWRRKQVGGEAKNGGWSTVLQTPQSYTLNAFGPPLNPPFPRPATPTRYYDDDRWTDGTTVNWVWNSFSGRWDPPS